MKDWPDKETLETYIERQKAEAMRLIRKMLRFYPEMRAIIQRLLDEHR